MRTIHYGGLQRDKIFWQLLRSRIRLLPHLSSFRPAVHGILACMKSVHLNHNLDQKPNPGAVAYKISPSNIIKVHGSAYYASLTTSVAIALVFQHRTSVPFGTSPLKIVISFQTGVHTPSPIMLPSSVQEIDELLKGKCTRTKSQTNSPIFSAKSAFTNMKSN